MTSSSDKPAANWRTLAPITLENALPPPGDYQGAVIAARLIDKPEELWLQLIFGLRDYPEEIKQLHCIAAAPHSTHKHRVIDGKRAIMRLLTAGKLQYTSPDPAGLVEIVLNVPLTLTIGHKTIDGVPELVIKNVTPANPGA
jgi:hypothetical protein